MRLSSKECDKHFGHLEDHQYRGYNRALGTFVKNKEHFIHLMDKGGYVPFEMGERMAEEQRKHTKTDYKDISDKTKRVIADLRMTADKKGRLSSIEGTKKACEEVGISFYHRLPSHYENVKVGGFDNGEKE
jgi:hypothetical protein